MCNDQGLVLLRPQITIDQVLPIRPGLDQIALGLSIHFLIILELSIQPLVLLLLSKKVLSVLIRLTLPRLGLLEDGLEVNIGLAQNVLS